MGLQTNHRYYGDKLEVLRTGYLPDESVDMAHVDPPFISNRDHRVTFKVEPGRKRDAESLAFEDTRHSEPALTTSSSETPYGVS